MLSTTNRVDAGSNPVRSTSKIWGYGVMDNTLVYETKDSGSTPDIPTKF